MTVASNLFRNQTPIMSFRVVHLDLKGVPPTFARLMELLKIIAAARYNAVLVEWEDTFPWSVDERFRCETAYTPEQVERFNGAALELGLDIFHWCSASDTWRRRADWLAMNTFGKYHIDQAR